MTMPRISSEQSGASLWARLTTGKILGHWAWTALMILVAAALALPQIDKYPPGGDAVHSYVFAGYTSDDSYSVLDALRTTQAQFPEQLPFYYVLLHLWGRVAGHSLAVARLPAVFCGLLSLALVYRLAREFVAPVAGSFAALILLSNAFYAFYYAHIRFYTLLVCLSALVIWLYLRIVHARTSPRLREYAALTVACLSLVSTNAFGLLLYALLAPYHLLAARKDRRWLLVMAAALAALLLAAPLLKVMLAEGVAIAQRAHGPRQNDSAQIFGAWATVMSNGSPILLMLSVAGAVLGWRLKLVRANPFSLLIPLLLLCIWLAAEVTGIVTIRRMRYFLVSAPVVVVFAASGLYALYRLRKPLALLTLLWLAAGLHFAYTAHWNVWIYWRDVSYHRPPWHLVSRWMRQSGENLLTMTFDISHSRLGYYRDKGLGVEYFGQYGIDVIDLEPEGIGDYTQPHYSGRTLSFWVLYQTSESDADTIAAIDANMTNFGYEACQTADFPNETVLVTYRWTGLGCVAPQTTASFATDIGALAYADAALDGDGGELRVTGRWQPQSDFDYQTHNLGFQLLDQDWRNLAQLDIQLEHQEQLRSFIIDVSAAPAGSYHLMAIVYNAATGERYAWHDNEGWIPEMRQLAEIMIPELTSASS